MTYIDYINRFMELNQNETFTAYDFALYATLLHTANRKGWPAEFECPTKRLLDGIKGMAKQTLLASRERLRQRGLIEFESGERNATSPVYRLLAAGKNKGKKQAQKLDQNQDQKIGENQDQKRDQRKKVDQKVDQNIDPYIRLKTKDIDDGLITRTHACAGEAKKEILEDDELMALFFSEAAPHKADIEVLCMQWHTTPEVLEKKAREVLTEWKLNGTKHNNESDQRKHFLNTLRIKIQEHNRTNGAARQAKTTRAARKEATEPRSVNDRWDGFTVPGTEPENPTTK